MLNSFCNRAHFQSSVVPNSPCARAQFPPCAMPRFAAHGIPARGSVVFPSTTRAPTQFQLCAMP
eukprot:10656746-Alexandrium_andersonii.AAC.1